MPAPIEKFVSQKQNPAKGLAHLRYSWNFKTY